MKSQQELQEHLRKQNWAASVIQKSVRHFLLRKKQEKINNGIKKIQVTENEWCLNLYVSVFYIFTYIFRKFLCLLELKQK